MSTRAVAEPVAAATPRAVPTLTPSSVFRLQRATCACGKPVTAGGECAECARKRLQRAASGPAPASLPPSVERVLGSSGRPLDGGTRSDMESRFGHDFSQVRVHDGPTAAESARDVQAKAYTVGQDVVFAGGQYAPHTPAGRHLLAHELAHTIQQGGLQRATSDIHLDKGPEYQRLEREAEAAASAALAGAPVEHSRPAAQPTLSRAPGEGTVTPAKSITPKTLTTQQGLTHTVTPTQVFTATDDTGTLEEFEADPFYLPGAKGPNALPIYERMATAGSLETTVELKGTGKTRTALWQERPDTADLRDLWFQKVGWTRAAADDLWARAGGDSEFPKVNKVVCQMDHIVELQISGNNPPENIQPLDPTPNQSSGSSIKRQLEALALAIAADPSLSSGRPKQVKIRFKGVKPQSAPPSLPSTCPPKGTARTCLGVEDCAKKLQVEKQRDGSVAIGRVDYPITAGGRPPTKLRVPTTFAQNAAETVKIEGDGDNDGASTLIPGLLLTQLHHKTKTQLTPHQIAAKVDAERETRLPLSLDPKAKDLTLNVGPDGDLKLDPALKKTALGFTFKYLSPGAITSITPNESGGVDWTGYIRPAVPFLGQLDIAKKGAELSVTKGLAPGELKAPFPGVQIAEASLGLKLAPEFKPEGKLRLRFGAEAKPLAEAELTASTDGVGVVADGVLRVFIPGVDTAEGKVTYKGGGDYGTGQWTGTIVIESTQIKLPYVSAGSVVVRLAPGKGVEVDGKVDLALPGENTATVGLQKTAAAWIFSGGGRFKVPKVGPVTAWVSYNTATKLLTASAKDVSFEIFGLGAKLDELSVELKEGSAPVFYGTGGVTIKKGKVDGNARVTLQRNGKFTGKGAVTYAFNDKLSATAGVELDEKERLKFSGKLVLTYLKLFDAFGDSKNLFDLNVSIPIPYASIGGIGLEARIGGGVTAGYSVGPGSLGPITFQADFYPLEENSDLSLAVDAFASIPASAKLTAYIKGGIVLDAYIAEVGGEIILEGWIELKGGMFASFSATYKQGKIDAKLTPEIKATLLLGLALKLRAWAKAGIGWLSTGTEKTWTLGRREVDTHLGFSLKAPIGYATDKGPTFPTLDQVELKKPEITTENLKRIVGELVSGATPAERET